MPFFKILSDKKLTPIKEKNFSLEKDIQSLSENNLQMIFGLQLVRSEFSLHKFRIDSLAFNPETKSFSIVEYKRNKNFSVIDQGYAYLSLMLNNKADFILEYNENAKTPLRKKDVDWSQSRVIFVSPSFTNYQKESINFKDLPIELWEIKRYKNQTVNFNQIKTSGSSESIKTIEGQDKTVEKVAREIKVYTEEGHLEKTTDEIEELYENLKNGIMNLGNLEIVPRKFYIAFVASSNITDIQIQKKSLKIWLNLKKGELDDPKQLASDVSGKGHLGNGHYEIIIRDDSNIEYILSLIKQALNKNK